MIRQTLRRRHAQWHKKKGCLLSDAPQTGKHLIFAKKHTKILVQRPPGIPSFRVSLHVTYPRSLIAWARNNPPRPDQHNSIPEYKANALKLMKKGRARMGFQIGSVRGKNGARPAPPPSDFRASHIITIRRRRRRRGRFSDE